MIQKVIAGVLILVGISANAQLLQEKEKYTKADTLRGSLRKERNFDVLHYTLDVKVEPEKKYISGSNIIGFVPNEELTDIQIDLYANMNVDSIIFDGKPLKYTREFDAVFIHFPQPLEKEVTSIQFYYSGNPTIAKHAPWDGGFVFTKSESGLPWIATACQGAGASLWWPNKDHQSDEPNNGMDIFVTVPNTLMDVSNGRLMGSVPVDEEYTKWHWAVTNPINNYDVALNIGDYTHFGENYKGLDMDFYVLKENLEKAKVHFEEVKPMMDCFQEKFGTYPFKEDSYKLVETPHLGMEHQSAVAYGNKYLKGYLGNDLSRTGVGLLWDFIIIHETGHEWYGNSITAKDIADMWIHEGFTTYSEAVYIECRWGYEKAQTYLNGMKLSIQNDRPVIGDYGVNKEGSGDMYNKGAMLVNTLRHIINDDEKWWKILKDYTLHFKHQTVTTEQVVSYFEEASGLTLKPVFDQYLRYTTIPVLQLKQDGKHVMYRWETAVPNFSMPFKITNNGKTEMLQATNDWKKLKKSKLKNIKVDTDHFYIKTQIL
ncbi:M1 family metallopeptidase [Neptunitalea lumnitzerae]|uniref:Peptidase M1 n=1 Tax=Neptunitalea lumnitzerae TaxID=2965509 RepID=A0ABQ5MK39_9FLAO|nr:M1 family metallopeptidase [Neptunitalea sp. Y10]GLB49778.1 peptidase M1 [Neptunitalea sp. Y10]